MDRTLRINGEKVSFDGLETRKLTVLAYSPGREPYPSLMLKEEGGNYWSGRGEQSYAGAHYRAMEILTPWKVWRNPAGEVEEITATVREIVGAPVRPDPNAHAVSLLFITAVAEKQEVTQ